MNPLAPADGLEPTDAGTTLAHGGLVERPSRVSFDLTVERLSRSVDCVGVTRVHGYPQSLDPLLPQSYPEMPGSESE
jgi:hypothetical protein